MVLDDYEQPTYIEYAPYSTREIREKQDLYNDVQNAKGKKASEKAEAKFFNELRSRVLGGKVTADGKTSDFTADLLEDLPMNILKRFVSLLNGDSVDSEKKS